MINSQTSRYKKVDYFIQENGTGWNVVEYPTNDVVRTFRTKTEADRVAKEISSGNDVSETTNDQEFFRGLTNLLAVIIYYAAKYVSLNNYD